MKCAGWAGRAACSASDASFVVDRYGGLAFDYGAVWAGVGAAGAGFEGCGAELLLIYGVVGVFG